VLTGAFPAKSLRSSVAARVSGFFGKDRTREGRWVFIGEGGVRESHKIGRICRDWFGSSTCSCRSLRPEVRDDVRVHQSEKKKHKEKERKGARTLLLDGLARWPRVRCARAQILRPAGPVSAQFGPPFFFFLFFLFNCFSFRPSSSQ
jgi:hypothetical protein